MLPLLSSVVRNSSTDLKAILTERVPKEQERVKAFRKEYGSTKVGDVTVDMVSISEVHSSSPEIVEYILPLFLNFT